jgi:iron complex transport system ATP-binding protein
MAGWVQEGQKTVLCVTHDIHNLYGMRGYVLNLSSPAPALEAITQQTVSHHLALLEHKLSPHRP